ncbi:PQ-loop domain-containing transporter [Priestia megaterium]|uniref:PQ-loop domain-containing transporter n=1 Tax=Priestia megaterium TaxID=1404 RepID=UPI00285B8ABD|nr:PQ-loop domain-containing transporter [Priestia megaterium]MDR7207628.1 MtN3 and saliva related transmembrane protein [Priestia megaterium]
MDLAQFFSMLQLIGGVILSIGYIPQIIKMIKTRSVDDFSKIYLGSIFFGIVLMEMYAVYMYLVLGIPEMQSFFITNTASTILSGTEFCLLMAYSTKNKK